MVTDRFINHHFNVDDLDAKSPSNKNRFRRFYTFDKTLTGLGVVSGVAGVYGIYNSYTIIRLADDKTVATGIEAGKWAGAWMGAEMLGGLCASVCPHPYVVAGAALIGGVAGSIGGEAAVKQIINSNGVTPGWNSTTCFVAGTKILLPDGREKNIENIKVGDIILNVNTDLMIIETDTVLLIPEHQNEYKKIIAIIENGIKLEFSPAHPLFVKNKGWSVFDEEEGLRELSFPVSKLELGDIVLSYEEGVLKEYEIMELFDSNEVVKMYNVEFVKNNHSFFANGILVHNKRIEGDLIKLKANGID